MSCILNIETSTAICSVALSNNGAVMFKKENYEGPSHAACLGGFVKDALEAARLKELTVDAVAVSCGPGSYTGLRIGVSESKGLCFGLDVPLIAVNTLEIMACHVLFTNNNHDEDTLFCPMIDARRMEVYSAIYNIALEAVKPVSADIIDENSYRDILDRHKVLFFGDGAEKCKDVLNHPNASFISGINPLASDMLALAETKFKQEKFENVAYFEPFYLKEFVATTPKHKVI